MKRTLLVVVVLWCSAACAATMPSRKEVARVVTAEFAKPAYRQYLRIIFGYVTEDREGGKLWNRGEGQQRACLDALAKAGLISTPGFAGPATPPYEGFVWSAGITKAMYPFIPPDAKEDFDPAGAPAGRVLVARPELLAVTGVTAPLEGFGEAWVEGEFTYRMALTPVGRALASAPDCERRRQLPNPAPQRGYVQFRKYDDGWRPELFLGATHQPLEISSE